MEAGVERLCFFVHGCLCIPAQQFHIHGRSGIQALPLKEPKTLLHERKRVFAFIFFFLVFQRLIIEY